jgi:hypothetical protein
LYRGRAPILGGAQADVALWSRAGLASGDGTALRRGAVLSRGRLVGRLRVVLARPAGISNYHWSALKVLTGLADGMRVGQCANHIGRPV